MGCQQSTSAVTAASYSRQLFYCEAIMDPHETLQRVVWLSAADNPFGREVLDCRPFCTTMLSMTKDQRIAESYVRNRQATGENLRDQQPPHPLRVEAHLLYPGVNALGEGAVFRAAVMEEKWDIFRFGKHLYFARSWTGDLHHRADLEPHPSGLRVTGVVANAESVENDPALAVRIVEFLIWSHVLGRTCPHPLPASLRNADKSQMALWSFQQFGRRGELATFADSPLMPPA